MTMFGIQVPAANRANGPGLGLALLEFLQSRLPAVASPAAVLAAAAPTAVATAHATVPVAAPTASTVTVRNAVPAAGLPTVCAAAPAVVPVAAPTVVPAAAPVVAPIPTKDSSNNIELNPALYKPKGFAASAALGSNLSVAKKGKLPVVE